MSDIDIPQPPRIPDAGRRIAIFRAYLFTRNEAEQAEADQRPEQASRLYREAERLLTASRS